MRTSLNVPEDLLEEFDRTWRSEGYDSRSRAVREAMTEYVEAHTQLETLEGTVVAVLAFDYEHEAVIGELHEVQHDYQDVIASTSHVHEGEWCLETVFCQGPADRVRGLCYDLRDFDAVGRVNVSLLQRN